MNDKAVAELLDDKLSPSFGVRIPQKTLDKVLTLYRELTRGAVPPRFPPGVRVSP